MISITPAARSKLLYEVMEKECLGIRARVDTAGCNGLAYHMEYLKLDEDTSNDSVYEDMLYIDPKSLIVLAGSVLDYKTGTFEEGFEFSNPNETSKCGCGESFYVD
jgi:iron-sulfur cluster assembly protein